MRQNLRVVLGLPFQDPSRSRVHTRGHCPTVLAINSLRLAILCLPNIDRKHPVLSGNQTGQKELNQAAKGLARRKRSKEEQSIQTNLDKRLNGNVACSLLKLTTSQRRIGTDHNGEHGWTFKPQSSQPGYYLYPKVPGY